MEAGSSVFFHLSKIPQYFRQKRGKKKEQVLKVLYLVNHTYLHVLVKLVPGAATVT